jgi:hypothetical protein
MSTTDPPEESQPSNATQHSGGLKGRWVRVTDPPPAADPESVALGDDASHFPAEIEFRDGVYRGHKGPGQRFIAWDAGTYSVGEEGLSLSLANDAIGTYSLEREAGQFTVVDALGRRTTYRRRPEDGPG